MTKFKIGDRLVCKGDGSTDKPSAPNFAGSGWELGKIIVVADIDLATDSNKNIYWPSAGGDGIYESYLEYAVTEVREKSEENTDSPEKLLVDGVVLFKELRNRKKEEIMMIDEYLDRVAKFSQKPPEESEKSGEEVAGDENGEPITVKARPKRKPRLKKLEAMPKIGVAVDSNEVLFTVEEEEPELLIAEDSSHDSRNDGFGDARVSKLEENPEHGGADKIWCAVCSKYHTKGTHD